MNKMLPKKYNTSLIVPSKYILSFFATYHVFDLPTHRKFSWDPIRCPPLDTPTHGTFFDSCRIEYTSSYCDGDRIALHIYAVHMGSFHCMCSHLEPKYDAILIYKTSLSLNFTYC